MSNVVQATFGGKPGYDEALFRQTLHQVISDNGGELTRECIGHAFEQVLEVAPIMKEKDPKQFEDYITITYVLLERERESTPDGIWRP